MSVLIGVSKLQQIVDCVQMLEKLEFGDEELAKINAIALQ